MSQRGAALPIVLALVSVVLMIGLAMGSLSTLSLQFNRRQLEGIRAEMAARGALAQLVATLRQRDGQAELNPLRPEPSNVAEVFPGGLHFQEGEHRVTIDFDTSTVGFSSDNLGGDAPAIGWPDSDDIPRIPPFGLDVVLNVEGPSSQHRFRAGLKRVWPFALYSKRGPILLMAVPGMGGSDNAPSEVKGDVYTTWEGLAAGGGTVRTGYGYGLLNDPSKVLANLEARAGFHPELPPNHHLLLGAPLGFNAPKAPSDVHTHSTPEEKFYYYDMAALVRLLDQVEDSPNFSPQLLTGVDTGNLLVGDFLYNHSLNAEIPPVVQEGSTHDGNSQVRRGLALDPLKEIAEGSGAPGSTFSSGGFQELTLPEPGLELLTKYSLDPTLVASDDGDGSEEPPFLLDQDLVLTESENSTGGPISSHYVVDGSISNRQVIYKADAPGAGIYVKENKAGMRLQGTVLHVKGDLDLSGTVLPEIPGDPEEQKFDIVGAGATLIVDGQLILGNATINAEDQGFVIYARDIVLKGGGNFCGLMIAENSITILSQKNPLNIKGGLLCAGLGGITLKGTRVEHDPNYLKAINGGGDFVVMSWKKL